MACHAGRVTELALPANGWQRDALTRLSGWVAREPEVVALRAHGSAALVGETLDAFADLDVSITALDPQACAERLIDMVTASFAPVFASARHAHEGGIVLRLVLVDLRRIDASITPPQAEFARTPRETSLDAQMRDEFDALTNDFLFEAVLAATKAGRADLLIASHLTLGLARHLLVGGMLLRDRDTGTRHHRHGGTGHDGWAAALGAVPVITDARVITSLIRRYIAILGELAEAFGRGPTDTDPLQALLDAVDAATRR